MAQLTVITMNCLGLPVPIPGLRRRLQALGRALAESDADLVCLQEVGRWRYLPLLRHDTARWPHAAAVDYPFAPKGGLVTLSRLPVVVPEYHAFRERGRMVSAHTAERFQGKGVLQTIVDVGEQRAVILNTHLAANYNAQWSYTNPYAKVERAQLEEIALLVERIPSEAILVVAGDFNVPRGSWLYQELLEATGLHDPLGESTEPTYRPLPGMPARAAQALDHVLVRVPTQIPVEVRAELCFREPVPLTYGATGYLSDHVGVRMDIKWPDRSQTEQRSDPATAPREPEKGNV